MPVTINGSNTPTAGGVVYGDGSAYVSTTAGSAGSVLYSAGASAPAFTAVGTNGQVLQSNGAAAPSWVTSSASQWTTTGLNIYYSTGKVGIGTSTIASQLDVRNGATNATGINTNANQISITHNSNTGVGGQAEPAGFVVIRDKASAVSSGEFLGGLSWNARYTDTEARAGYASILAVATGSGTADLTFNTSSSNITTAERLRLNGNGALILSGGTATADGIGLVFPASQSASTNANCLDDYEEGTWTPIDGSGASLSLTVSGTSTYTKIGRVVNATCHVAYPSTANSSNASIGGLPFTVASTGSINMQGGIIANTNRGIAIYVMAIQSDTRVVFTDVSDVNQTNANMSTKTIRFTAVYIV